MAERPTTLVKSCNARTATAYLDLRKNRVVDSEARIPFGHVVMARARGFLLVTSLCAIIACSGPRPRVTSEGAGSREPPSPNGLVAFHDWSVSRANLDRLAGFARVFDGKHIVYLGEPDHYIHEKYAYQLLFTVWLFDRGFRHLGFEMGRAQGRRFDRYIESGDESWLGINDEDRDSLPTVTGALSFDGSDPAAKADSQERRRFFRALRDMSERRPAGTLRLHVFGFDVDFFPTLAFRDVRDGIGANHPRLASVARAVDRAREASGAEAARRMSEAGQILHEGWRDASAELGGEAAYALEADIGSLAATLRFQSIALHDPTPDQLLTAYATRERNMFWLLDRHFARSLAEGTALIGHNMHLSKHSSSIGFGRAGAVVPMWPSVGDHVRERWADDVASVWFLYAAGQHGTHAGCKARGCDIPRHPEAIETELATAGSRFVVTTAAAEAMFPALRAAGHFIQNGELGFGVVSEQADVFVFDETVTAPRLDVEAPARLP